MDRRLTILETRFDTILPTLATKADLAELKAELKAEIHQLMSSTHRWMIGTMITIALGFGSMFAAFYNNAKTATPPLATPPPVQAAQPPIIINLPPAPPAH